jgi:hypothetical protein
VSALLLVLCLIIAVNVAAIVINLQIRAQFRRGTEIHAQTLAILARFEKEVQR